MIVIAISLNAAEGVYAQAAIVSGTGRMRFTFWETHIKHVTFIVFSSMEKTQTSSDHKVKVRFEDFKVLYMQVINGLLW